MIFNRTLRGFLRKEFRQALRDPRMRTLLFVAPAVQLTIFGVAISNEVKNLRLAAVYAPSDQVSRDIHERAIATGWFIRATDIDTQADPFTWVQSDRADAVLVAPSSGLERAIQRGRGRLQLLINAKNVVRAQAIENYIQGIIREVRPPATRPPLGIDIRVLYNPTLTTSHFMVPGVMGLLLAVITIVLTSMSIARERETGTLETLISAPVETWEVILGKSIPFVTIGMVQLMVVLTVATVAFGVPFRGPFLMLVLAGFCYVCATVSIGVLISTITKSQQQAMLGGFLFLMPALLFSGLMFPLENMPGLMRWVAYINPVAHFVFLTRNILLKGGDWGFVAFHMGALAVIAAALVTVSFRRFHTSLQ